MYLPNELLGEILEYTIPKPKKLRHFFQENFSELDWNGLSKNPAAIYLLEQYPTRIHWPNLSENPAAVHLLEQNFANGSNINYKIDFKNLSKNPAAIHLIEQNLNKISWTWWLSRNENAVELLERYPEKIFWSDLSKNPTPRAIRLLENNMEKIDFHNITQNPLAVHIIEQFIPYGLNQPEFMAGLSRNPSESAVRLLEQYPDKINWSELSRNPATRALCLLKENIAKIDWSKLSKNPAPDALRLLEENIANIDWSELAKNPTIRAVRLIEKNLHLYIDDDEIVEMLCWKRLSANPAIFEDDDEVWKKQIREILYL